MVYTNQRVHAKWHIKKKIIIIITILQKSTKYALKPLVYLIKKRLRKINNLKLHETWKAYN